LIGSEDIKSAKDVCVDKIEIEPNYNIFYPLTFSIACPNDPQETTLASHLACAYKILQDSRFDRIEQEHLARSCKYLLDPSYAR